MPVTPPDELTIRWDETAERTVGVGDLARTRPELVAHHRRDKAKKETRERAERETSRAKAETERVDDVWRQLGELWEKDLADHEKRWEEPRFRCCWGGAASTGSSIDGCGTGERSGFVTWG